MNEKKSLKKLCSISKISHTRNKLPIPAMLHSTLQEINVIKDFSSTPPPPPIVSFLKKYIIDIFRTCQPLPFCK